VLDFPELAGRGIDRKALCVAMAIAPDLRLGVGAADERIVFRRRAIGRDADQLAQMVAEVLRFVTVGKMLAQRYEQVACRWPARSGKP